MSTMTDNAMQPIIILEKQLCADVKFIFKHSTVNIMAFLTLPDFHSIGSHGLGHKCSHYTKSDSASHFPLTSTVTFSETKPKLESSSAKKHTVHVTHKNGET